MRVLGIDPGYAIVGWGVVEYAGNRFAPVDFGAVCTDALPAELTVHILFCQNQLDYNTISDAKKQGFFQKL